MQMIKIKRYSNKLHEVCGKSCHPVICGCLRIVVFNTS